MKSRGLDGVIPEDEVFRVNVMSASDGYAEFTIRMRTDTRWVWTSSMIVRVGGALIIKDGQKEDSQDWVQGSVPRVFNQDFGRREDGQDE